MGRGFGARKPNSAGYRGVSGTSLPLHLYQELTGAANANFQKWGRDYLDYRFELVRFSVDAVPQDSRSATIAQAGTAATATFTIWAIQDRIERGETVPPVLISPQGRPLSLESAARLIAQIQSGAQEFIAWRAFRNPPVSKDSDSPEQKTHPSTPDGGTEAAKPPTEVPISAPATQLALDLTNGGVTQ